MSAHLDEAALLDYWFGDADEAACEAIDAHLLACDACGARLDGIAALGSAVRAAFDAGRVGVVLGSGFVERLGAQGRRLREYRVPLNGSVLCTVTPQDDVLVGRLQVPPLPGVRRLDLAAEFSFGAPTEWLHDVPFDAAGGEIVFVPRLAEVRLLPAHEMRVRLLAVEDGGAREIGHYTFRHTPSA